MDAKQNISDSYKQSSRGSKAHPTQDLADARRLFAMLQRRRGTHQRCAIWCTGHANNVIAQVVWHVRVPAVDTFLQWMSLPCFSAAKSATDRADKPGRLRFLAPSFCSLVQVCSQPALADVILKQGPVPTMRAAILKLQSGTSLTSVKQE